MMIYEPAGNLDDAATRDLAVMQLRQMGGEDQQIAYVIRNDAGYTVRILGKHQDVEEYRSACLLMASWLASEAFDWDCGLKQGRKRAAVSANSKVGVWHGYTSSISEIFTRVLPPQLYMEFCGIPHDNDVVPE